MTGPRAGWEAPVTVAELVNAGPLAGARMYGSGENPVHQVRIVDELSVFGTVAPHTAVVLIGTAASGGWAVEMATRHGQTAHQDGLQRDVHRGQALSVGVADMAHLSV
ncbi:hypothetical protein, partial [Nonomuraea sp. NPDC003201]